MSKNRKCQAPRPTVRVVSPLGKPLAWCPGCQSFQPAGQVAAGKELRRNNKIIATYAPLTH